MALPKPKLKFPDRKISETFLQYAEPLLDALGPNATDSQMEKPLMIAWTIWNAVVYADAGNDSEMLEKVCQSMGQHPELQGFAEAFIHRKRTLFGDDLRLIGEYKLIRKDGGITLRAEARDPTPSNRSG